LQWRKDLMGCTSMAAVRRMSNSNFICRYFVGDGVDIGGGIDALGNYGEFFPRMGKVRVWDWPDGDAQLMQGVADNSLDFVYSSHCLEHVVDPRIALKNWFRILKPGGYMVVVVPDEDMYEQGIFPSTFNGDHKSTFTILKQKSWSPRSQSLVLLLVELGETCEVEKIELLNANYRYDLARFDQTATNFSECGIEFVVRKRLPEELVRGGKLPPEKLTKEQTLKSIQLIESLVTEGK
jgi:SAM-dependent methyltransferase